MKKAEIKILRALQDNYCYLIHREGSRDAMIVDPSEAAPIVTALKKYSLNLVAILNTHHHHDHVGGNLELLGRYPEAQVFCSKSDLARVPGATRGLVDGESFEIDGLAFSTISIPGHTTGQLGYYLASEKAVFVGDTLFSMGCGRLFEGTPAQMLESLRKLMKLDDDTRIFFGHEYALKNAQFALTVDPLNPLIGKRALEVESALSKGETPPAPTIGSEKRINPFLRPESGAIRASLKLGSEATDVAVFAELRERRNTF